MELVGGEAWDEPPLQREATNLPELTGYPRLLGMRQRTPPPGHGERGIEIVVHELPADALESRHIVAVDDVNPLGSLFTDQGGPFVGALAATHDKYARAAEILEVHEITGMRANSRGHGISPRR